MGTLVTEPWGGTDLPSALKGLPGAFRCCGGTRPLLCGRLKGTASATTSRWKHSSGILGLLPSVVGAPEHKNLLLHEWGAPKCNGMFLAGTDAAGHNGVLLALRDAPGSRGVLLAPGMFLAPRGAPGPRVALTPVVPVGEQQARRRELLTAASCSRKLSTSLCAASARCKGTKQESDRRHLTPHGVQDLPQSVPLLSILLPPPAS